MYTERIMKSSTATHMKHLKYWCIRNRYENRMYWNTNILRKCIRTNTQSKWLQYIMPKETGCFKVGSHWVGTKQNDNIISLLSTQW